MYSLYSIRRVVFNFPIFITYTKVTKTGLFELSFHFTCIEYLITEQRSCQTK